MQQEGRTESISQLRDRLHRELNVILRGALALAQLQHAHAEADEEHAHLKTPKKLRPSGLEPTTANTPARNFNHSTALAILVKGHPVSCNSIISLCYTVELPSLGRIDHQHPPLKVLP